MADDWSPETQRLTCEALNKLAITPILGRVPVKQFASAEAQHGRIEVSDRLDG